VEQSTEEIATLDTRSSRVSRSLELHSGRARRSQIQRPMGAMTVVVINEHRAHALEMPAVQDQEPVRLEFPILSLAPD